MIKDLKHLWHCIVKPPLPKSEKNTIAQVIWETRRYGRLAVVSIALTMVSTSLLYGMAISPIFFEPVVTNSAVSEFIASENFRAATDVMFRTLDRYNNRRVGERVPKPSRFQASSGSQLGIFVQADYQLVNREKVDPMALDDVSALAQYSYSPTFTIHLDPRYLLAYIGVMSLLLAIIFYIVGSLRESKKHDDSLLESLQTNYLVQMKGEVAPPSQVEFLIEILGRFHAFAKQIVSRYGNRKSMSFGDEYDVQDALHALLRMHYLDVRAEEYTPSYAGKSARMDFLINDESIVVETKMTRKNLRDKELGDELLIDISRYQIHAKCRSLICFIYDPQGLLASPHTLIADLEEVGRAKQMEVRIVVSPLH